MEKRDFKKDAWQVHVAFHDLCLKDLDAFANLLQDRLSKDQQEEFRRLISNIHSTVDTVIMWVENLSDELLKTTAMLEEARRIIGSERFSRLPESAEKSLGAK